METSTFPSVRTIRRLDVALAIWAVLWIGVATGTAYEVSALRSLGDTVVKAGIATESAGRALEAVGRIPFVGGRAASLGAQAVSAGESAQASGHSSRGAVDRLAVLLGVAIGLVPTLPLLALYLPYRRAWRRDRRAVANAVARWDGEPGLDAYLARRALVHLTYDELRALGSDRHATVEERDRLAAAELRRLGLGG